MSDEQKKPGKMPSPAERPDLYDDYDNPETSKSSVKIPDDLRKVFGGRQAINPALGREPILAAFERGILCP